MSHPFEDKLFAFIGNPKRCSRRQAREALDAVGGVTDERILSFTEYVVAFEHDGKTKKYAKAVKDSNKGYLILLDEDQFFDILEGKSEPPSKANREKHVLVIETEESRIRQEESWKELLNHKRMTNMAKYGTTMPDGSIAKIDLRPLDLTRRIVEMMKKQPEQYGFVIPDTPHDYCNACGKPAKVHFRANEDSDYIKLCQDCYNDMMAEYTGIEMPDFIPQQFLCNDDAGKSHKFDIEFLIFATGKELTTKEKGKFKRRIKVHGELDADVGEMLQLLKRKIIKAINTIHIDERGYINNGIAEGYIDYNSKRDDYDIIIDGKPYTWEELKKNISMHEGWNIRIEFGDYDDVVE
jgi:hypothetical protein